MHIVGAVSRLFSVVFLIVGGGAGGGGGGDNCRVAANPQLSPAPPPFFDATHFLAEALLQSAELGALVALKSAVVKSAAKAAPHKGVVGEKESPYALNTDAYAEKALEKFTRQTAHMVKAPPTLTTLTTRLSTDLQLPPPSVAADDDNKLHERHHVTTTTSSR